METNLTIFSAEELSEIQSLQIRGGTGINPLAQSDCEHAHCTIIYPSCTHDKCTIHLGCGGSSDTGCSNIGCTIIKPQKDCLCHLES